MAGLCGTAEAQTDAATVRELLQRIDQLQRRLDALEAARPARADNRAIRDATDRAAAAERSATAARAAAANAERDARAAREARSAAPAVAAAAPAPAPAAGGAPSLQSRPASGPVPPQGPTQPPDQAITIGTLPGSFRIPGTDSSVRLYGVAVGIATRDFEARNRSDNVTAQSIPLSPSTASRQGGDFRIDARRSRIGLETSTPTAWGVFHTVAEFDFAGSQSTASLTSQASTSGYLPRLRLAYGELGPLLVGQNWSLFFDDIYPQRLDYATPFGVSNVRQAQLRYTHRFDRNWTLSGSVENPYTDATISSGTRYDDSDALTTPVGSTTFSTIDKVPDLLAKLRWEDPAIGHAALTGLVRPSMGITNAGDATPAARYRDDVAGWGVQFSGSLKLFERDRAYLRAAYGGGIGRYLDSMGNGQGLVSNATLPGVGPGQIRTNEVHLLSGVLGYTHYWTPEIRSNATVGWGGLYYPSYVGQFATAGRSALNKTIGQGLFNLVWSPIPRVDLGVEYIGTTRTLETPLIPGTGTEGAKGGLSHRVLASGTFRF